MLTMEDLEKTLNGIRAELAELKAQAEKSAEERNRELIAQAEKELDKGTFQRFKANLSKTPEDWVREGVDAKEKGAGLILARVARGLACAKGNWEKVPAVISDLYKDRALADHVEKVLSNATGAGGGYLVGESWSAEIIPLLRAKAVLSQLGARVYPMDNAIEHVPTVTAATAAYWVGDTDAVSVSQPTFGQKTLTEKYLAGLVPVSQNLIRSASPAADAYVRDDLMLSMSLKLDLGGIEGDGTGNSPFGLKNLPIQTFSVAARPTADTPIDLYEKLRSANIAWAKPGQAFNSRIERDLLKLKSTTGQYYFREEMMANGTVLGVPYRISTQITNGSDANELTSWYYGDFNEMLIGERVGVGLQLDSSDVAAYNNGSSVVSAYQTFVVLIRALLVTDILVRQDNAFVRSTDVHTVTP